MPGVGRVNRIARQSRGRLCRRNPRSRPDEEQERGEQKMLRRVTMAAPNCPGSMVEPELRTPEGYLVGLGGIAGRLAVVGTS